MGEQRFEWVCEVRTERGGGNRLDTLTLDDHHLALSRGEPVRYADISQLVFRNVTGGIEERSFVTRRLELCISGGQRTAVASGSLTSPEHTPAFVTAVVALLRRIEQERPDLTVSEVKATSYLAGQIGWLAVAFISLVLGVGLVAEFAGDLSAIGVSRVLILGLGLLVLVFAIILSTRLVQNMRRQPRRNVPLSALADALKRGDPARHEALGDWFPTIIAGKSD